MGHNECAVYHDLNGRKAPGVKLHNFVTKQVATEELASRLRFVLENGNYYYPEFRKDRFIEKTTNFLPTFQSEIFPQLDYKPACADSTISNSVLSAKMLASA
jgi:hypothetical protein